MTSRPIVCGSGPSAEIVAGLLQHQTAAASLGYLDPCFLLSMTDVLGGYLPEHSTSVNHTVVLDAGD